MRRRYECGGEKRKNRENKFTVNETYFSKATKINKKLAKNVTKVLRNIIDMCDKASKKSATFITFRLRVEGGPSPLPSTRYTMMRRPAHSFIGGAGGWRLVGVGFLFGAALATCLTLFVIWSVSSGWAETHYRKGFWHAQRASEKWCFPRGGSNSFPVIMQWEHPTPDAALAASSIASGRIDHVKRVRLTSPAHFESALLAREQPTVIEGLTEEWPAWLGDTSADGQLARHAGDAKMRVETSENGRFGHVEPTWGDTAMTLREFFAGGHCGRAGDRGTDAADSAAAAAAEEAREGEDEDEEAVASLRGNHHGGGGAAGEVGGVGGGEHMYLSFNPPDDILRAMAMERWPVPCLSEAGGFSAAVRELLVWIGTGTDSTLHNDSWENVFCVTSGRKDVVLLDPAQGALVGERVGHDRVSFVLDPAAEAETFHENARRRAKAEAKEEAEAAAAVGAVGSVGGGGGGGGGDGGGGSKTKTNSGESSAHRHRRPSEEETLHAEGKPTGPIVPLKVSIHPGECLYIPSYWFHQVISPPGVCTVAVTLWLDLLRLTSRISSDERIHLPSSELKRRLLRGGVPVACARTVRADEERVDDAR